MTTAVFFFSLSHQSTQRLYLSPSPVPSSLLLFDFGRISMVYSDTAVPISFRTGIYNERFHWLSGSLGSRVREMPNNPVRTTFSLLGW